MKQFRRLHQNSLGREKPSENPSFSGRLGTNAMASTQQVALNSNSGPVRARNYRAAVDDDLVHRPAGRRDRIGALPGRGPDH